MALLSSAVPSSTVDTPLRCYTPSHVHPSTHIAVMSTAGKRKAAAATTATAAPASKPSASSSSSAAPTKKRKTGKAAAAVVPEEEEQPMEVDDAEALGQSHSWRSRQFDDAQT